MHGCLLLMSWVSQMCGAGGGVDLVEVVFALMLGLGLLVVMAWSVASRCEHFHVSYAERRPFVVAIIYSGRSKPLSKQKKQPWEMPGKRTGEQPDRAGRGTGCGAAVATILSKM